MVKPLQIGITGGIGVGKSTVSKIFSVLGVPTYDADSRAKAVMTTDGILVESIKKEFGTLSAPYVLKEAALLIESGSYKTLDYLMLVTAPEEVRIGRVLMRDKHRSIEQIKEIIKNQLSEAEKLKLADFTVNNDGTHSLIEQVLKLHEHFLQTLKRVA